MSTLLESLRRLFERLRRRTLLHRRPLAALCAATAVLLGLEVAAPPPPRTVRVWTAARDLAAGRLLGSEDLVSTAFSPESVPSGAVTDPRDLLGRTLAAPMLRGEPLSRLRVVGRGLLRGYPGRTAVPMRITDADVVGLLHVGDEVSVVVADPDGRESPTDLVADAPVMAIPQQGGTLGDGTPGRLVVLAVPSEDATEIATRAAAGILIPVWTD